MKKQKKSLRFDATRWFVPLSCAAIGVTRLSVVQAADIQVVPALQVMETYVDNILLAPPGQPKDSEMITQIIPSLGITADTNRLTGALNYSAQGLLFNEHSENSTVYHQGALVGQWRVFRDLFYVDTNARYTQQSIDPAEADNPENFLLTNNLTSRLSGAIAPTLSHDFGSHVTGTLRQTFGVTKFTDSDQDTIELQDSNTEVSTLQVGSTERESQFVWDAVGKKSTVDFDIAPTYKYDQAFGAVAVETLPSVWWLGTVGLESDLIDSTSEGGLDETFWFTGFRWAPNQNNQLQVQFGHRFFGKAYNAEWTRTGRIMELVLRYTEEPTTDSESSEIDEFIPGRIRRLEPGEIDLDSFETDIIRATFQPYVRKALDAEVVFTGRVSNLRVRGYQTRREYLDNPLLPVQQDDDEIGVEVQLDRRLSAMSTIVAAYDLEDASLRQGGDFRRVGYNISYLRSFSSELQGTVSATYREGTGNGPYDVSYVSLGLRKSW